MCSFKNKKTPILFTILLLIVYMILKSPSTHAQQPAPSSNGQIPSDLNLDLDLALQNPALKLIVSGIMTCGEYEVVDRAGGVLVEVRAPVKIRYHRALKRRRVGDNTDFKTFTELEARENSSADRAKQNISLGIQMADYVLINNGTLRQLNRRVDTLIRQLI